MSVYNIRKNNRGLTLVELLVVMALMALVLGIAVIGIPLISSGNEKKATQLLETNLNELRTNTLSISADWKSTIYNDNGICKISIWKGSEQVSTASCGSGITISFQDSAQTDKLLIAPGTQLTIAYMVGSGKFSRIMFKDIGGTETGQMAGTSERGKIIISNGKSDRFITLWYETGRITED